MTVGQAARKLRVSESTIWRLLRRGSLTSARVRGRRRIAATSVLALSRGLARFPSDNDVPTLTLEDALFTLAGRFRSNGRGPGSSDKRAVLHGGSRP